MDSLQARHLMTKNVVTLNQRQSLPLADGMMKLHHVRHLPVVDDRGRLVGLVTHRDLVAAQISTLTSLTEDQRAELQLAVPVARVMSERVWTVRSDTPAVDVAELLIDNRFGCVPVVDTQRKLLGIVTEADFMKLAVKVLAHAEPATVGDFMTKDVATARDSHGLHVADELISIGCFRHLPVVDAEQRVIGLVTHRGLLAAQHSVLSRAAKYGASVKVGDIMEPDVWTIEPSASQLIAARTLADHQYGCLPVVEDGKIVGIVTEADFLKLLVDIVGSSDASRKRSANPPVNYYATRPARCVALMDDLDHAQQVMSDHGVSSVGVIHEGELLGVLSRSDLFAVAQPRRSRVRPSLLKLPTRHVSELMTRDPKSIHSHDSVVEAAQRMVSEGIHRLFVVEGTIPVGVFSTTDMMRVVRDLQLIAPITKVMAAAAFTIDGGESLADGLSMLERSSLTGLVVTNDGWPVGCFGQREALHSRDLAKDIPLRRAMNQQIVCVPASTPLFLAGGQASALNARRVVVMDGAHIVGVASGMDFARAVAQTGRD